MNKIIKRILKIIGIIIAISAIIILGINVYVKCSVNKKIVDVNNINGNYDAILVLVQLEELLRKKALTNYFTTLKK